jgi:RecA-family ATPase
MSSPKKNHVVDIMAAFTNEPPVLDFIWPGFLVGTVGAIVAPGAAGKSFWALEAAMSVACDLNDGDRGDIAGANPRYAGKVLYLAAEDPHDVLVGRVHHIGQHLNQQQRQSIAENLILQPVMGKRLDIMNDAHFERVQESGKDCRLIVFDTLSRIHHLDENSNGEMSQLISQLERLAATGPATMYLHHVSKGSAREGRTDQQAGRGASALVDNARWCGYVSKMTEDESCAWTRNRQPIGQSNAWKYVRFGVSKQNYAITEDDVWLERVNGGVLKVVELEFNGSGGSKGQGQRGGKRDEL